MKGMKKPLALLLALVMAFSLLSVGAWADEEEAPAEEAALIDLGGEEALPETPAEEVAETPEEEAAPAEEVAEAPEEAVLLEGEKVAKIGETEYATLAEAVAAASGATTITLIADIADMATVEIPAGKEITLDLAGHTITAAVQTAGDVSTQRSYYAIDVVGSLTVKDSVGNGYIAGRGVGNHGVLTLESGEIRAVDGNGGAAVWNYSNSTFTMNGGKLYAVNNKSAENTGAGALNVQPGATATINNGTFETNSPRCYALITNGITTINNATVTSHAHGAVSCDAGQLTINDGTFTVANYYSLYTSNDGGNGGYVIVNGGYFGKGTQNSTSLHVGSDVNDPVDAAIYVKGGTFEGNIVVENKVTPDCGIIVTGGTFLSGLGNARLPDGYGIDDAGNVYQKVTNVVFTPASGAAQNLVTLPATLEAGTYKLLTDVTVDYELKTVGDVTIDFNGKTLTANIASNQCAFRVGYEVNGTTATFTGGGRLAAAGKYASITSFSNNNTINIEAGVTIDGCVYFLGDGNTVNVKGTVNGRSDYGITTNGSKTTNGKINIYPGAVVTADDDNNALYIPAGAVTITGGTFSGGNAILIKGGSLNISGGTFTGTKTPPKDYTPNNNGFVETTGEAILVDHAGGGYGAQLAVSITGGTFISEASYAVRTVGRANTDRNVGFISGGAFQGKFDILASDLLADGYRLNGDGQVVAASATVEAKDEATETAATYTVTTTGESATSYDVTVTASDTETTNTAAPEGSLTEVTGTEDVANNTVQLSEVKMDALLGDLVAGEVKDNNGSVVAAAKVGSDNKNIEFAMTATPTTGATATSITLEIHPTVKIGSTTITLPNKYIKAPMKVVIPNFFKNLTLLSILHNGASVPFEQKLNGSVEFESDSYSAYTFTIKPVKADNEAATLTVYTATDSTEAETDGIVQLPDFTTTAKVRIMGKATTVSKPVTLSAYDVKVTLPKELSYASAGNLIEYAPPGATSGVTKNADGTTTIRFMNYGERTGTGAYYEFPAPTGEATEGTPVEIGYFLVTASDDAVYDTEMSVTLTSLKEGKTGVEGEFDATVSTTEKATFKLMKTYTIKFTNLSDGTTAMDKSADVVVGHNKTLGDTLVEDFTDAEKAYFTTATMSGLTPKDAIGYTFDGWDKDLTPSTAVTADATYAAQWLIISYKITFKDEESATKRTTWTPYADITYNIQSDLNIALPTKTAYGFDNWDVAATTDGKGMGNWETSYTAAITGKGHYGDVTLTAKWTPTEYPITFTDIDIGAYKKDVTGVTPVKDSDNNIIGYTYNIEKGIGDSELAGYTFDGWTVTPPTSDDKGGWDAKTYDVGADFKGKYGAITLKPNFIVTTVVAFVDYAFATPGEALMLVKWDGAANSELKFTIGETAYQLYKTDEAAYATAFNSKVNDTDKVTVDANGKATLYVTIVPTATLLTKDEESGTVTGIAHVTYQNFAIDVAGEGETKSNVEVTFTGDVIQASGAVINPDGTDEVQISLADLSNANDMLKVPDMFAPTLPNILGRLHADINADAFANISDLAAIQGKIA